jgi:hypothetical protein
MAADITKYTFTALLSGSPVAGGAGSAQRSAFPSPVRQERTAA